MTVPLKEKKKKRQNPQAKKPLSFLWKEIKAIGFQLLKVSSPSSSSFRSRKIITEQSSALIVDN